MNNIFTEFKRIGKLKKIDLFKYISEKNLKKLALKLTKKTYEEFDIIVKEGIQAKLSLTPENSRYKLQQALTKLVNKGSGNLFAIVI